MESEANLSRHFFARQSLVHAFTIETRVDMSTIMLLPNCCLLSLLLMYLSGLYCKQYAPTSDCYLTWFIQARLCKIQGLLKTYTTVFKDYMFMKHTESDIKI